MFGKLRTPSARPSLFMFRIDRPRARIRLSLVLYRIPRSGSLILARDRNRMDSYLVSTVDVPESPIPRSPRQQQRCDSLHCHEKWWGSCASRSPQTHSYVLRPRTSSILCTLKKIGHSVMCHIGTFCFIVFCIWSVSACVFMCIRCNRKCFHENIIYTVFIETVNKNLLCWIIIEVFITTK